MNILIFFKNKKNYGTQCFKNGYAKANKKRIKDLKTLKKNAMTLLNKKTEEIESRDKHLRKIELILEDYICVFADAKYLSMKIEEEKEIELRKFTAEYSSVNKFAAELQSLDRRFSKRMPKLKKKIDEYKIKHLN